MADLRLRPEPAPLSPASTGEIADNLREWTGPGLLVICGGLFEPPDTRPEDVPGWVDRALAAHPDLRDALRAFTSGSDRRILLVPSASEAVMLADETPKAPDTLPSARPPVRRTLDDLGIELAPSIHLHAATAVGERVVVLRAGPTSPAAEQPAGSREAQDDAPEASSEERPWLAGMDRLERPTSSESFVTSRTLYRRLGRYAWWLLVPVMAALLLRLPFVLSGLTHLFGNASGPRHAFARAHNASWGMRLVVAGAITVVELVVLAIVLAVLSRRIWVALGGRRLPPPWRGGQDPTGDTPLDPELDEARALVATGAAGLIEGGNLRAELVHLGPRVLRHPGRDDRAGARAPRPLRPPAGLPAPSAGFLPGDRDGRRSPRAPAAGRRRSPHLDDVSSGRSPPRSVVKGYKPGSRPAPGDRRLLAPRELRGRRPPTARRRAPAGPAGAPDRRRRHLLGGPGRPPGRRHPAPAGGTCSSA